MNPTPGILYLVDGTVKCAERERPELEGYAIGEVHASTASQFHEYEQALKSWEADCKDVVNVWESSATRGSWYITTVINEADYDQRITDGQKVLKVPEGEKVRITSLIP